jgi:hypothetical protein
LLEIPPRFGYADHGTFQGSVAHHIVK